MAAFVIGATGNQGRPTAEALLRRGATVYGLTRDMNSAKSKALAAKGCKMVAGGAEDATALATAFRNSGATTLFVVVTPMDAAAKRMMPDYSSETRQAESIASALKETAGQFKLVVHCTFASTVLSNLQCRIVNSKQRAHAILQTAGVPMAELQPTTWCDIWLPWHPLCAIKKEGAMTGFTSPEHKLQFVTCKDVGEFAAIMMLNPAEWAGKRLAVAGDDRSMNDVAALMTRMRGSKAKKPTPFGYKRAPVWLFRLVVKDVAELCDLLDRPRTAGGAIEADVSLCRRLHPGLQTWEDFITEQGLDTKELAAPGGWCY